jgi:hypothetical protein
MSRIASFSSSGLNAEFHSSVLNHEQCISRSTLSEDRLSLPEGHHLPTSSAGCEKNCWAERSSLLGHWTCSRFSITRQSICRKTGLPQVTRFGGALAPANSAVAGSRSCEQDHGNHSKHLYSRCEISAATHLAPLRFVMPKCSRCSSLAVWIGFLAASVGRGGKKWTIVTAHDWNFIPNRSGCASSRIPASRPACGLIVPI